MENLIYFGLGNADCEINTNAINSLSLRGVKRRSNPRKDEIATLASHSASAPRHSLRARNDM